MEPLQRYWEKQIAESEQARDWASLPADYAVGRVRFLARDIYPHIPRHCIRARVMLSQAQTFDDLRATLTKAVDEHNRKLAKVRGS